MRHASVTINNDGRQTGSEPQNEGLEAGEAIRAQLYRFLSNLLSAAPGDEMLAAICALSPDQTQFGQAMNKLVDEARDASPQVLASQYQDLFVGVGRGEFVPYGSYYLTGFLNEKPLAKLRDDLVRLGVARDARFKEPEDHIATLMEIMTGLIDGTFGEAQPLDVQKIFFEKHIASWAPYFFEDLSKAKSSKFYAAVGAVGAVFLDIEMQAFEMS